MRKKVWMMLLCAALASGCAGSASAEEAGTEALLEQAEEDAQETAQAGAAEEADEAEASGTDSAEGEITVTDDLKLRAENTFKTMMEAYPYNAVTEGTISISTQEPYFTVFHNTTEHDDMNPQTKLLPFVDGKYDFYSSYDAASGVEGSYNDSDLVPEFSGSLEGLYKMQPFEGSGLEISVGEAVEDEQLSSFYEAYGSKCYMMKVTEGSGADLLLLARVNKSAEDEGTVIWEEQGDGLVILIMSGGSYTLNCTTLAESSPSFTLEPIAVYMLGDSGEKSYLDYIAEDVTPDQELHYPIQLGEGKTLAQLKEELAASGE